MSSFAERLVSRGARVASVPGFATLQPRPLSRFEAVPATAADGPDGPDGGAVHARALAASAEHISAAGPERKATHPDSFRMVATDSAARAGPLERGGSEIAEQNIFDQRPSPMTIPSRRGPHSQDAAAPIQVFEPESRSIAPMESPEDAVTVSISKDTIVSASRSSESAEPLDIAAVAEVTSRPRQPALDSVGSVATAEQAALTFADIGKRPVDPRIDAAEANRAPSLAVTVGRIDVQFVQPPQRPVAAPQPQRSRGFETYARARRGEPR